MQGAREGIAVWGWGGERRLGTRTSLENPKKPGEGGTWGFRKPVGREGLGGLGNDSPSRLSRRKGISPPVTRYPRGPRRGYTMEPGGKDPRLNVPTHKVHSRMSDSNPLLNILLPYVVFYGLLV